MASTSIQFFQNKKILVTGATGFLAKVFVEKILRVQPNVKKMYLVVRAANEEAAMERLRTEVFENSLFKVLRENLGDEKLSTLLSEKVVPVAGDISADNLNVMDSCLRELMQNEIEVVVNVAASTKFDQRYDVALGTNTFGSLNVLNFAKNCVKAHFFLHVSTAYVCGEKSGLLHEKPFVMEEICNKNGVQLDINFELKLTKQRLKELNEQNCSEEEITLSMKELGMKRAKLNGWPNTYVFTKSMGEMLLGNHKDNLPLVIIRPTMITSTLCEPYPGWIEGLRTVDSVIIAYGKGALKCFLVDVNSVSDMIPVDMVVNAMIAAAAKNAIGSSGVDNDMVYHVGSSNKNPITYGEIRDISVSYFTQNPLRSRGGSLITVPKARLISNMALFSLYMTLRYKLPLKLLKWSDKYGDKNRKLKLAMRLVHLYKPYVLFKGIFDDRNTESLRVDQKKEERKDFEGLMFDFDPNVINWKEYLTNIHIPGLITHVLKN